MFENLKQTVRYCAQLTYVYSWVCLTKKRNAVTVVLYTLSAQYI